MNRTWSIVIPYYNERGFLSATLQSLCRQTLRGFTLILVDNASTDGSPEVACQVTAGYPDITVRHITEPTPGQVHALETGIAAVDTDFVAICDADTLYPPDYLERANAAFARGGWQVAAVMAMAVKGDPRGPRALLKRIKGQIVSRIWPRQLHTGGYGHCFRTAVLRACGGYSKRLWPYVLKDHELMHRVFKQGSAIYPFGLWCRPSQRRADRRTVRWTLRERLMYHFTAFERKDWFFYEYLAPRFARRRLDEINLRQQSWAPNESTKPHNG